MKGKRAVLFALAAVGLLVLVVKLATGSRPAPATETGARPAVSFEAYAKLPVKVPSSAAAPGDERACRALWEFLDGLDMERFGVSSDTGGPFLTVDRPEEFLARVMAAVDRSGCGELPKGHPMRAPQQAYLAHCVPLRDRGKEMAPNVGRHYLLRCMNGVFYYRSRAIHYRTRHLPTAELKDVSLLVHRFYADIEHEPRDYAKLAEQCERILSLAPDHAEARGNLVNVRYLAWKHAADPAAKRDGARKFQQIAEQALSANPEDAPTAYATLDVLRGAADTRGIRELAERVGRSGKSRSLGHYLEAAAAETDGRRPEALAALRLAVAADKENGTAREALAVLERGEGNAATAAFPEHMPVFFTSPLVLRVTGPGP